MRTGRPIPIDVEDALGPGVDIEFDLTSGRPVARRARNRGPWLGLDRGSVVDTDDGHGRRLPALIGLPASTFAGCRIEARVCGALSRAGGPPIIVTVVPGAELPVRPIVEAVARLESSSWLDGAAAQRRVGEARSLFRERRARRRIVDGRAWSADASTSPFIDRFSTPHSLAEYSLAGLAPRFLRGLDGLLDADERVLYWVERPQLHDLSIVERVRGRIDRRAALLLLTDRQLLWLVDHAQPDVYLSDWGVDVEAVPIENLTSVAVAEADTTVSLEIETGRGTSAYALPSELGPEVHTAARLAERFLPRTGGWLPRRKYSIEPVEFDGDEPGIFGQEIEADRLRGMVGEPLGFVFSPRRDGQRTAAGMAVDRGAVHLLSGSAQRTSALAGVHAVRLVLSPLIGRVAVVGGDAPLELVFPATFSRSAANFVRLVRRLAANS